MHSEKAGPVRFGMSQLGQIRCSEFETTHQLFGIKSCISLSIYFLSHLSSSLRQWHESGFSSSRLKMALCTSEAEYSLHVTFLMLRVSPLTTPPLTDGDLSDTSRYLSGAAEVLTLSRNISKLKFSDLAVKITRDLESKEDMAKKNRNFGQYSKCAVIAG